MRCWLSVEMCTQRGGKKTALQWVICRLLRILLMNRRRSSGHTSVGGSGGRSFWPASVARVAFHADRPTFSMSWALSLCVNWLVILLFVLKPILQALCCVDKKGILSWPNPTAEKVFFLRSSSKASCSTRYKINEL